MDLRPGLLGGPLQALDESVHDASPEHAPRLHRADDHDGRRRHGDDPPGGGRLVAVLAEGDALRNALPSFDEILDAGGSLDDAYRTFARKARSSRAGRPPRW